MTEGLVRADPENSISQEVSKRSLRIFHVRSETKSFRGHVPFIDSGVFINDSFYYSRSKQVFRGGKFSRREDPFDDGNCNSTFD